MTRINKYVITDKSDTCLRPIPNNDDDCDHLLHEAHHTGHYNHHLHTTDKLYMTIHNLLASIGVDTIFSWVHLFSLEKVEDPFLVIALKTQANTAKLTTPTQQKCPQKLDSCSALGVHLQLFPVN